MGVARRGEFVICWCCCKSVSKGLMHTTSRNSSIASMSDLAIWGLFIATKVKNAASSHPTRRRLLNMYVCRRGYGTPAAAAGSYCPLATS
eukprot:3811484-Rhodomonas_salina.3